MNDNAPIESSNKFQEWLRRNAQILYGFFGWYLVNGLFWYLWIAGVIFTDPSGQGFPALVMLFTFPVNLLALIMLSAIKRTRKIGLGILTALALNFLLSLIFGSLINGICFLPFYWKV